MRNGELEGWKNLLKLHSQNEKPMILDYQFSFASIHYIYHSPYPRPKYFYSLDENIKQ